MSQEVGVLLCDLYLMFYATKKALTFWGNAINPNNKLPKGLRFYLLLEAERASSDDGYPAQPALPRQQRAHKRALYAVLTHGDFGAGDIQESISILAISHKEQWVVRAWP